MLQTLGMRIRRGRTFSSGTAARTEAIVNQALVRSGYLGADPIGRRIYSSRSWQVIGVVDDVAQFAVTEPAVPAIYVVEFVPPPPGVGGTYFAIRFDGPPALLAGRVRRAARDIDAGATIDAVATMEQLVTNSISRPRLYAVLLGLFAAVALTLAAIGLYGMMSHAVGQRTRELGIRVALGAQRSTVMSAILRQSAVMTGAGIAVGLAGAAMLTPLLDRLLYGVAPLNPSTYVAVVLTFLAVATVASMVPARRAAAVDPLVALRHD
jgi:putative ABC transport system permease protein